MEMRFHPTVVGGSFAFLGNLIRALSDLESVNHHFFFSKWCWGWPSFEPPERGVVKTRSWEHTEPLAARSALQPVLRAR